MKVLVVFGTRPEAIKLAPVIAQLQQSTNVECRVCGTGQHIELARPVLDFFGIRPDVELATMVAGQSLASLSATVLTGLAGVVADEKPDVVVVQGDTTTAAMAALAAFYAGVPVAHVEAGLRTGDNQAPFPEALSANVS